MVTTTQDVVNAFDNLTSLREAVALANTTAGKDTVTFAPAVAGGVITLAQGQFILTDAAATIIDGP